MDKKKSAILNYSRPEGPDFSRAAIWSLGLALSFVPIELISSMVFGWGLSADLLAIATQILSIALAIQAIRAIRRDPQIYKGVGLAWTAFIFSLLWIAGFLTVSIFDYWPI